MCDFCAAVTTAPQSTDVTTINLVVPVAVVPSIEAALDEIRTEGLGTLRISEREDGPAESFIAVTGPTKELEQLYVGMQVCGVSVKAVPLDLAATLS